MTWKSELRSGQRWDTRNYVFCPFLNKNPFNPLKPPFSFSLLSQKVTFDAGPQLQFLFHSDSSNNEWGYKFTVTALGLPDITISWMSDLQLLVARLMGRLASRTLALKSPHGETAVQSLFVKSHTVWFELLHMCCDHLRYFLCSGEGLLLLIFVCCCLRQKYGLLKSFHQGKCPTFNLLPYGNPFCDMACVRRGSQIWLKQLQTRYAQICSVHSFRSHPPCGSRPVSSFLKLVTFPLFRQMHGASMS